MKPCFNCKVVKPFEEFNIEHRPYAAKLNKGRVMVCIDCCIERAKTTMSAIKFNFEINQYETIYFQNIGEIEKYFREKDLK